MRKKFALFLAALVAASGVHAELKGSYALDNGRQRVDLFYLDDQHLRANVDDKNQLVLKGDESWLLSKQGGQWLALDMNQVGGLLKAVKTEPAESDTGPIELRDTGRTETVAGYPGKVFELSAGDKKYELVLSDHPDVLALTNGWRKLALKLSENLGPKRMAQLQQALTKISQKNRGGLLREGNQLTLIGIDKHVKSADADFPANTQVMQLPKFQLPGMQ